MSEPKDAWEPNFLDMALVQLYEQDRHLIDGGKERAATARLACHLTDVLKQVGFLTKFPEIRIDAEYGREGNDKKRNAEGAQVVPDIIVHVPGKDGPNVAVVEIKGWWNPTDRARDEAKLRDYQAIQHYAFSYFVELGKDAPVASEVPLPKLK